MAFDLRVQDGDLVFQGGRLVRVTDPVEAVAQRLQMRLTSLVGDWPLDESFGFDWLGQVLIRNPNPLTLSALLKETITGTQGVARLTRFELLLGEQESRSLTISFDVQVAQTGEQLSAAVTAPGLMGIEQDAAPSLSFEVL